MRLCDRPVAGNAKAIISEGQYLGSYRISLPNDNLNVARHARNLPGSLL